MKALRGKNMKQKEKSNIDINKKHTFFGSYQKVDIK